MMRVTVPRLPLRGADGGRKEVLVRAALDPGDWERYLHPHDREAALAALPAERQAAQRGPPRATVGGRLHRPASAPTAGRRHALGRPREEERSAVTVPKVKTTNEHLQRLVAQTGAVIQTWKHPPETTARLVLGDPPRILIPQLRSRRAYFDGLHEFGHLKLGHQPSATIGAGHVFLQELEAWVWPLEESELPPTLWIQRDVEGLLWTGCPMSPGSAGSSRSANGWAVRTSSRNGRARNTPTLPAA
jgi:hypothetical protein